MRSRAAVVSKYKVSAGIRVHRDNIWAYKSLTLPLKLNLCLSSTSQVRDQAMLDCSREPQEVRHYHHHPPGFSAQATFNFLNFIPTSKLSSYSKSLPLQLSPLCHDEAYLFSP